MTPNSYSSLCDDFYVDMCINTEMDLPTQRDTVLAFFERIQKQYPSMNCFYRRDNNDYCLEESRHLGEYRWVTLETDRIGSGVVNPSSFEMAYQQDKLILELVPYMLSVSHLDIDSLDITFAMDFVHKGNHDEVIADAFFGLTPFGALLDIQGAKAIGFSPAVVVALSEDCHTQGRISIESKTSIYEPHKREQRTDEAISLSFTVRQFPPTAGKFDPLESFERQYQLAQELMAENIVPNFVHPLTETIAQKRMS
ncbi:MAG: hypothetical protein JW720_00315 [Sedimentisphaerales bacterium]|nr:hypothetical protein [Sedimentisphaerales bacterium]